MPRHTPETCQLCEVVPPQVYRRHWKHQPREGVWHHLADGPDLMRLSPRPAHFLTVLAYRLEGGSRHYHGPLYFEFDADDPSHTLDELRSCVRILEVRGSCPPDVLQIWHSGGRGFHVLIPPELFGAADGHAQLPTIYQEMVRRLFSAALLPSLDYSIYSMGQGRMWRLPNRLRTDTKRYKVPVSASEVLHQSYPALEALTRHPRHGVFWRVDDLQLCPGLTQLYHDVVTTLPRPRVRGPRLAPGATIPAGQRNVMMLKLAGAMRRVGAEADCIFAALVVYNRRCTPPLDEAELEGIAHGTAARYPPADHHLPQKRDLGFRTVESKEMRPWQR
jgi:hypothetical protein